MRYVNIHCCSSDRVPVAGKIRIYGNQRFLLNSLRKSLPISFQIMDVFPKCLIDGFKIIPTYPSSSSYHKIHGINHQIKPF